MAVVKYLYPCDPHTKNAKKFDQLVKGNVDSPKRSQLLHSHFWRTRQTGVFATLFCFALTRFLETAVCGGGVSETRMCAIKRELGMEDIDRIINLDNSQALN